MLVALRKGCSLAEYVEVLFHAASNTFLMPLSIAFLRTHRYRLIGGDIVHLRVPWCLEKLCLAECVSVARKGISIA